MARSTRNKVRFQVDKAAEEQNRSMEHLYKATELADGRSEKLNKTMPKLIAMLEGSRKVLLQFRDEL